MQPDIIHTGQYITKDFSAATEGVASQHSFVECFICGRHQSRSVTLRLIRRWKAASRKVILVIDSVCSICDDKHKLISSKPNQHAKQNNN